MPQLKLTYFDMAARAEPIRLALFMDGIEFEDCRILPPEFATLKPTLPSGQLLVLEVDGYVLSQSHAILRYIGNLTGLYPQTVLDAAKCDAAVG